MTALTPRPTMYAGTQMRSRLEAEAARQFDIRGWEWTYEPLAYADYSGTYLPDFEVTQWKPVRTFVEVKPAPFFRDYVSMAVTQRRMEIILASIDYCPVVLVIYEPNENQGYVLNHQFFNSELEWFHRGPLFPEWEG